MKYRQISGVIICSLEKEGVNMECVKARKQLFRKIDDELSKIESEELDLHLSNCSSCEMEHRILSLPRNISQASTPIVPSPFFYPKLMKRIENETHVTAGWQPFSWMARTIIPALAGITLALLSLFAYFQTKGADVELYSAYESVFIDQAQQPRTLHFKQDDVTDANVLSAIVERDSSH
jgi:predicted anti-sigma-YlaC factor YlaD